LPEQVTAHFPRTRKAHCRNAWRFVSLRAAAKNFSTTELIRAMDLLLEQNRQLVTSNWMIGWYSRKRSPKSRGK